MNCQATHKKKPKKGFMHKIYKQPPKLNTQREAMLFFKNG